MTAVSRPQLCVIYRLVLIKTGLAPGSDVPDAVAPGTPLQMTQGATTSFLPAYKLYTCSQMREHQKLNLAEVNAAVCVCERNHLSNG